MNANVINKTKKQTLTKLYTSKVVTDDRAIVCRLISSKTTIHYNNDAVLHWLNIIIEILVPADFHGVDFINRLLAIVAPYTGDNILYGRKTIIRYYESKKGIRVCGEIRIRLSPHHRKVRAIGFCSILGLLLYYKHARTKNNISV